MQELKAGIQIPAEEAAVVSYLAQTWAPIEGLSALVADIRATAFHQGRGWLDEFDIGTLAHDRARQRQEFLVKELPGDVEREREIGATYDRAVQVLDAMWTNSRLLVKLGKALDGPWDYSRRVDSTYAALAGKYPDLARAKPLGWDELEKDYVDFGGQEKFDSKAARNMFKGADTATAGSDAFPIRVGLPHVMYDDKCQGRRAPRVLVGAIFSHFLVIREFLNTLSVLDAIKAVPQPNQAEVLFSFEVETENPFVKVLLALNERVYTEEDYREAIDGARAYERLSAEEKAERAKNHDQEISELMAQWAAEDKAGPSTEEVEREKHCLSLLQKLLTSPSGLELPPNTSTLQAAPCADSKSKKSSPRMK